jgi:hypothetical protein
MTVHLGHAPHGLWVESIEGVVERNPAENLYAGDDGMSNLRAVGSGGVVALDDDGTQARGKGALRELDVVYRAWDDIGTGVAVEVDCTPQPIVFDRGNPERSKDDNDYCGPIKWTMEYHCPAA